MTAYELLQQGKLDQAIEVLGSEIRNNPSDIKRRTFLFELLCFAGAFDRAEKQLDIIADAGREAALGTFLYRSALNAERIRQKMFAEGSYPKPHHSDTEISGIRGSQGFIGFTDSDPRIGEALEVFVAGSYVWISFEQIASVEIARPKRLRDLLWAPAMVTAQPNYRAMELGEVLVPTLSPLSFRDQDDDVRLGRSTIWCENEAYVELPLGQKLFVVGKEEIPILELGKVEFSATAGESRAASA
jgi:type VI secretion system protein ImpE